MRIRNPQAMFETNRHETIFLEIFLLFLHRIALYSTQKDERDPQNVIQSSFLSFRCHGLSSFMCYAWAELRICYRETQKALTVTQCPDCPPLPPLAHFLSLKVCCEAPAGVATVWQVRVRRYRRGRFDPLSNFVLNDNPLHLVQLSCRFWFS